MRISILTTSVQHCPRGPNQYIQVGRGEGWEREEVKLSPFADYMIIYVENPKGSIESLLEQ